MKFDDSYSTNGFSSGFNGDRVREYIPTPRVSTNQRPALYRTDPFPEPIYSPRESFQREVDAVIDRTSNVKPLTLQEARDRLASLVSQITAINQSIENERRSLGSKTQIPEHIVQRRKRASRARNILQQESNQIKSLIQSLSETESEKTKREELEIQAKSRAESVWTAYMSGEDVLDEIERTGSGGALSVKFRNRSKAEVPQLFRDEWQRTHVNGVYRQPDVPVGDPAVPLKSVPASLGDRLAAVAGGSLGEQKLVRYQGKKKPAV